MCVIDHRSIAAPALVLCASAVKPKPIEIKDKE